MVSGERRTSGSIDAVSFRRRLLRAFVASTAALGLVAGGLAFAAAPATADTNPPAGLPETVTSDPLPTAQINGVVWSQAIAGNTVYVGGEFTNARPAGAAAGVNTSPRQNLMAYSLSTGVMTSWNPGANGAIKTVVASADGSRIYVGGSFTTIAGQPRNRIAAFNAATGALLAWNPGANSSVTDVAAFGNTVWIAGNFSSIAGGARTRIAAVNATTGALLPFTAAVSGGYGIKAVVVNPTGSKIVIAGSFTSTNGSTNPGRGMAALNAVSGTSETWLVNSLIRNGGENAAINSLTSDGDSVYGVGYDYYGTDEDGFEGTFRANWSDGSMVWMEDCHGDNYSVAVSAGVVYTASHDHYCGNVGGFPQTSPKWTFHHSLAFAKDYKGAVVGNDPLGYRSFGGQPSGTLLHWYPDWQVGTYTGKSQATWDITTTDDYVAYGGEFLAVNGVSQQGLVRFAKKATVPDASGPQDSGAAFPVNGLSIRAGEVRLSWSANRDRDNATLTYELYRQDKGSTPIYTTTADSNFWNMPSLKFTDKTVSAGQTYQYRVRAIDPNGNQATGAWSSVTATSTPASSYSIGVLDDGAEHYWPLGENSGTSAIDWADGNDLVVNSATRGVAGQNQATASKATQFGGSDSSFAASSTAEPAKNTLSIEAWVKTTSTAGGKIVGFGNATTGNSGSYDRHVYMDGSGRITFGVYPNDVRAITSATGYNDGAWHYVSATLGADGMKLYIDGKLVANRGDTTSGQDYNGVWRIGGDNIGGWPNAGSSNYIAGAISDVAIYDDVLTRTQINQHWVNSGRTSTVNPAPTDAYGQAVYNLAPTLFWRLDETAGSTAADSGMDSNTGMYVGNVQKGTAGAVSSSPSGVSLWPNNGDQTGIVSNAAFNNPTSFALESWFKTDSTSGGKIIGFGEAQTGTSNNYDRHLYMSGDGRVKFGVWTGSTQIVETDPGFNDNKWHHVVAQLSSAGMQLYVDGALKATSANTSAQSYSGYWRVGGDNGWEGDTYWRGSVDEVAIYPAALTTAQVDEHYQLGTAGFVNQAPTVAFSAIATDLSVAFDGSTTSDSDGSVASYAWTFGDGQTGTGVSPTHVYATAGTYAVTLTATDNLGASASLEQEVVVVAANQLPTAAFTPAVSNLSLTADGSASTDPDGTISNYSWAYGDGAVSAGVNAAHTYAAAGDYDVTLTVTDNRGGSASTTQRVTAAPPVNAAPVAAFTSTPSGLTVSVDGSSSTDSDGSVASYAWAFQGGGTATGATASYTFPAAGTYNVTLTVTDDKGATNAKTQAVTVTAAPPAGARTLAADTFGRTAAGGWGTADQGGAWTVVGTPSRFAVAGGVGTVSVSTGQAQNINLAGVSSANTRVTAQFSVDKLVEGQYISVVGRQVGASQYILRARPEAGGGVRLYVLRDTTALGASFLVPGMTLAAGEKYSVSFEVTGASPTNLSAKIWKSSDAEPATWQLTRVDAAAAASTLQASGSVGLFTWLPSSAAASNPVLVTFDNISVIDPTIP
ncbi:PKD domain-containing protein [Microbacterium sp. P03]|uniref:PKD domain-containing protein n=1 Tax=Microbacterium sp. P03 TaxID=3366946 RepID=UPI00374683FC